MKGMYVKFGIMLICSFIVMYAAMFLNVAETGHIMLSYTRTYMALLMVAPMAIIMLGLMWPMYKNKKLNFAILGIAAVVFIASLALLRNQEPIKDIQYMKAMIPHHSSAIMVSEEASLQDPETIELSKEIIKTQKEEIAQMKKIIERLKNEK